MFGLTLMGGGERWDLVYVSPIELEKQIANRTRTGMAGEPAPPPTPNLGD